MDNGEETNREQNVSRRRQRNDDGDEVPKAKRSRVSRACDQCRLSRDKCDGKSPCQTCTTSGRDCSYTTNPKKRGIQPGYIRTLESALALLFQRDAGAQKFLSGQLSRGPLRQYVKDGNHSEELHAIWTNSSVCKQIDAILSGSPTNDFDASEDQQDGPTNELHASLPDNAATNHSDSFAVADLASTFHQPSHSNQAGDTWNGDAQALIGLPPNFWDLMDHYYAFTHNWLPISEKNDVLKTAYLYPLRGVDQAITQSGIHAELWAIVALSSRQIEPSSLAHRRYTELARSFVPDHSGTFDKGHVRAQILMSLLCVGEGQAAPAWIKIGLASRILTHLGLHRSTSGKDTKDRHLVFGCLAIDNMIGLYLDLPGHLSAIHDLRRARVDEDGLEEWTPWQSPSQPGPNANQGLLNREPGRCLSTFNALVDALRQPEAEPIRHAAIPKTPHQLHLETVRIWVSYKAARVTHQACSDRMSDLVSQMIGFGDTATAPPTVAFLLRDMQRYNLLGTSAQQILQRWTIPSLNPSVRQMTDSTIQRSVTLPSVFANSNDVHLPPLPNTDNWVNPPSAINAGFRRTVSFGQETAPSNLSQSQQPVYDQIPVFDSQRNNLYEGRKSHSMAEAPNNTSNNQDTPSGVSDGVAMNSEFEAIFEEMAQLDAGRQMDDEQFMQNLGLGPDSDLRAFFGADYQETDPLLAYLPFDSAGRMQPGPTYPT